MGFITIGRHTFQILILRKKFKTLQSFWPNDKTPIMS